MLSHKKQVSVRARGLGSYEKQSLWKNEQKIVEIDLRDHNFSFESTFWYVKATPPPQNNTNVD